MYLYVATILKRFLDMYSLNQDSICLQIYCCLQLESPNNIIPSCGGRYAVRSTPSSPSWRSLARHRRRQSRRTEPFEKKKQRPRSDRASARADLFRGLPLPSPASPRKAAQQPTDVCPQQVCARVWVSVFEAVGSSASCCTHLKPPHAKRARSRPAVYGAHLNICTHSSASK